MSHYDDCMIRAEIIPDADDAAIAAWIGARLAASLAATPGNIAFNAPGGGTPQPILARLAAMSLDWRRIAVWPGDDRIVPEDHPASNIAKIRACFEPAGARIVPLSEAARPPHFALSWIGMGGDGHIASLFPSEDPRADDPLRVRRVVPDPLPPEAPFARLSLTIPALVDAGALVLVIRGAAKRAVLDAALAGESDLPIARLLRAAGCPVTCFT